MIAIIPAPTNTIPSTAFTFPSFGLVVVDGEADEDEELVGLPPPPLLADAGSAETPEELEQAATPPGGDETKVISAHYIKK